MIVRIDITRMKRKSIKELMDNWEHKSSLYYDLPHGAKTVVAEDGREYKCGYSTHTDEHASIAYHRWVTSGGNIFEIAFAPKSDTLLLTGRRHALRFLSPEFRDCPYNYIQSRRKDLNWWETTT